MKYVNWLVAMGLVLGIPAMAISQNPPAGAGSKAPQGPMTPTVLPGRGLAQHDFLYAGEAKNRQVFIVKMGQVVWSWEDPQGRGEISDAVMLSNGNILIAHQYAVKLISPEKKVLWSMDAPPGAEIHSAQPIGTGHVLYIQNSDPALLRVVAIATGEVVKEFKLPVKNPKNTHGHFRHARVTPAGTVLVGHMDLAKAAEYDAEGHEVWSCPAQGIWGVEPLKNGNILITDRNGVHEVNRQAGVVWEVTPADVPLYRLSNLQLAWRLPNGNTLFNNWFNQWSGKMNPADPPIQAIEVTPQKKVVWALRAWGEPVNLGPATTIQILDEPMAPEKVSFAGIR